MRAGLLLAALAALYSVAAWSTSPGFFEGGFNPEPYRWSSPPPQFRAGNQAPEKGSASFRVGRDGTVDPGSAFTSDGQASLSFVPGSFSPPRAGGGSVVVTLVPVAEPPDPGSLRPAGNVYLITATEPLLKQALVKLTYSSGIPAPDRIYHRDDGPGATWQAIPSRSNPALFALTATTSQLGYFAAGYSPGAFSKPAGPVIGGGQTLPLTVAALVLLVLAGGIPLAIGRRRRGSPPDDPTVTEGRIPGHADER